MVRPGDPQRQGAAVARRRHDYVVPDLLFAEAANAIWKKIRRKELTAEEGRGLVADISRIAVETVSCRALAEDAHALATATGRTVYDCMYVALAARLKTRSITADDRLEAALRSLPALGGHPNPAFNRHFKSRN